MTDPDLLRVVILIEGYARETSSGWQATSTTTLVESQEKLIIVDPGIHRSLLLERLKERNLSPQDIDMVFLTHYHPDHAFLAPLFEDALVLDGDTIYSNDQEIGYKETLPHTSIEVLPTPGHAHEHSSLIVRGETGKTVIAGDVFWWVEGETFDPTDLSQLISRRDDFARDQNALKKSRESVLEIADFIVPGHGKMFKNPRK